MAEHRSLKGKTVLVTGSTDGIGREAALELAQMSAHVIVHGRSEARCKRAAEEIQRQTGNGQVDWVRADYGSLAQVRGIADEINDKYQRLDVLVNDAGVYMPRREITQDGFETTFQVNQLAPFLLTNLLLDLLKKSAPSRIIVVSSTTHQSASIDFGNLQGEKQYDGYEAYAVSKLGNILFTYELAARLEGTGVTANCLHPGAVNTKLLRAGFGDYGISPHQGAQTLVYLASSPDVEGVTGKYWVNRRPARSAPLTYNRRLEQQFWELCAEMTGLVREQAE